MSDQNPYSAPDAALATANSDTYNPSIFSFSGRIGRLRYLAYSFGVSLILMGVMMPLVGVSAMMDPTAGMSGLSLIAYIVLNIASIVITIMFGKRRLNDLNRSAWYLLLFIVPLVNLFFIIYIIFFSGTDGENKYGLQASPNTMGVKILALFMPVLFFVGIAAAIIIPAMQV
ncbi:MAG: DUF805 domain-containing protein [Gammaproteobacteria bacterium]|nr:DUF805 domain-containing protein [Gammaproteobacteria bacterium]